MFKKSLISVIIATALAGCGGDDNAQLDSNTRGSIEITGNDFFAGGELSALATDADGIQAETLVYVWSTGVTGPTYTITEADEGSPISVSANYTDNAGFTEGVGASTEDIKPTFDVSASIVKGPVEGASCEIYEVNTSGQAVFPQQADAPSDASGNVTFTGAHIANNGLLSCTGGSYIDESTGLTLEAPLMRSVVKVVDDIVETDDDGIETIIEAPVYVVSPLTEIAVQNTEADFNNFDEVAAEINARFGIRFDTTEVAPTVVGTDALGADGADNNDRYGSVLALISQLDADNTDADISTVISDLSTDIADGDFADSLDIFEAAQANLQSTSQVASFADSDLLDIIGASVGYNDTQVVAIIEGEFDGVVRNTAEEAFTGSLTIIDPNFSEDSFIEQTDVVLTYGSFSIDADGTWSYTVNTENETVASLEVGDSVTDSITIASVDGTTAEITIRVAALTQVVEITNTAGDTGEILFRVDNLRQGKLSASFLKEVAIGSDGNSKDAYIKLGGSSGSNSESLIDLRIQGDQTSIDANGTETPIAPRLFVRNTDSDLYPGETLIEDFNENQFYDIDITWDLDASEQITVSLDGEIIFGGSFSTPAVVDTDFENLDQWFADGIQTIQFRLGDNGTTIPFGSYFVDNIEVFSDTAGTTSVFSDDFESYNESASLADASLYAALVYAEVVTFDAGDGTVEATPAVFFDLGGSIASDETSVTGAISVQDINEGEASITASTTVGTYGTFNIEADGSWTYTLDTTNSTIAALIVGERETDTFTITSIDGTTAEFNVLISGTIVVATGDNKVAVIVDTDPNDTGELRYELGDNGPLAQGRVEAKVKRLDDSFGSGDAFITLYNSSTNNGGAILDLRIKDDSFEVRDSDVDTSAPTVVLDQFMDVVITWEYPNGDTDLNPDVTVEIDGVSFTPASFTTTSAPIGGVTHVAFRFGSNGDTPGADAKFTVDDLAIFSDTAGTTSVFSDDFESYVDGDSLDTDNATSKYHSNTSEATVETIAGAAGGPGTAGNKFAAIADTLTTDTGELRYSFAESQTTGSVSFSFKKDITTKNTNADSTGTGTASVTLYGSSTSSSAEVIQVEMKSGTISIDDGDEIQFTTTFVQETEWVDVSIDWDATNAAADGGVTLTVTVNNTESYTVISPKGQIFDIENVQFKLGGGDDTYLGNFSVDDLIIIGADGTEILNDNFEGHVIGDLLDGTDDKYHSNSSEATVNAE
ncbi:VCBS domain-containing protein [Pseudocolwellia sp. AS88]|uniref:VCBS domain-containing protein n=1 Tax=Pseudocolwellia sp. AS88 TaxID=3063958 RepID=UPI0026E9336E|nr:VCBS domain-containing protein [Pseudocolwellia sp. AS88]MDO7085821.1 VCBS domain-containing protein [Pseudocolwellia sp. AS88]